MHFLNVLHNSSQFISLVSLTDSLPLLGRVGVKEMGRKWLNKQKRKEKGKA